MIQDFLHLSHHRYIKHIYSKLIPNTEHQENQKSWSIHKWGKKEQGTEQVPCELCYKWTGMSIERGHTSWFSDSKHRREIAIRHECVGCRWNGRCNTTITTTNKSIRCKKRATQFAVTKLLKRAGAYMWLAVERERMGRTCRRTGCPAAAGRRTLWSFAVAPGPRTGPQCCPNWLATTRMDCWRPRCRPAASSFSFAAVGFSKIENRVLTINGGDQCGMRSV